MLGVGDPVSLRVTAAIVLAVQPVSASGRSSSYSVPPEASPGWSGRERFGSIAGALAAFVTGATAIAPIGAGFGYDHLGSYEPLFWTFVLVSAVAAAVVLLVRCDTGDHSTGRDESAHRGAEEPAPSAGPAGGAPSLVKDGRRGRSG